MSNRQHEVTLFLVVFDRHDSQLLTLTPFDDEDLFIESIPYAETRLYVKTVSRNRFEYRRIYEASTKP